jgi:hypothetical protein
MNLLTTCCRKIAEKIGMRKAAVLLFAVILVSPAVTFAGSVTSKYDVTIGGYVKFGVNWVNQGQSLGYRGPMRGSGLYATKAPQIWLTEKFSSEFPAQFSLVAPYQIPWGTNGSGYGDDSRSLMSDLFLDVVYKTPGCGQIGPSMLQFGLGGMIGKEKINYSYGTVFTPTYEMDNPTRWGASLWGYIPIIPDRKGNKANTLGLTGNIFTGQGPAFHLPVHPGNVANSPGMLSAYTRSGFQAVGNGVLTLPPSEAKYPITCGAWVSSTYYFTDALFTNALFGFQSGGVSELYSLKTSSSNIEYLSNLVVNLMYDVNPAVRLGLEYTYIRTQYNLGQFYTKGKQAELEREGNLHAVRFGAYYFF